MQLINKHALGLNISDYSLEVIEIKKKFKSLSIVAFSRVTIAPGVVSNGDIQRPDELVAALRKLIEKRKFSTKQVVVSIPESRTFIHVFRLPAVISEKNIGQAVQYKAEETIPLSFNQAAHDYQILTKDEREQEVLYCATFRETAEAYRRAVLSAGLVPVVLETESLALARSLARDDVFEGVILVDCGARTTIITVYDHAGIRYSENIPIAGNTFTEKISHSYKISIDEAERLKRKHGLQRNQTQGKPPPAMVRVADEIVAALQKIIRYYQRQSGFVINRAIICGGTSLMPGLVEYFSKHLQLRTERGNPLEGLTYDRKILKSSQAVLYSTAIGLALRGISGDAESTGINFLRHRDEHVALVGHEREVIPEQTTLSKTPAVPRKSVKARLKQHHPRSASVSEKKRLMILGGVFVFLILIFGVLLFWRRGQAEPLIKIINTNQGFSAKQSTVDPAEVYGLQQKVLVYAVDQNDMPPTALAGNTIETTVTRMGTFTATGSQTVADADEEVAITIYNDLDSEISLIATTRFLTTNNVLLRLREGVTIPAGDKTTATVYTDARGTLANAAAGRLTIPGLDAGAQTVVYGELSETAISGVSTTVKVVTDTDLSEAIATMTGQFNTITAADVGDAAGQDELVVPEPLVRGEVATTASVGANTITNQFTITAEAKVTMLTIPREEVMQLFTEVLKQRLEGRALIADYRFSDWSYTLNSYDIVKGVAEVTIMVRAVAE